MGKDIGTGEENGTELRSQGWGKRGLGQGQISGERAEELTLWDEGVEEYAD